jgi:DNA-damage-inducible protein D
MGTIMPHDPQSAGSPFDAIRHMGEGGEHWNGRELMSLLGYRKWERFSDAMDMAYHVIWAEQGETAADLAFSRYREKATGGAPRENVRLTRYAAYLTAMRGDSRKPEIRAALIYFAVKTREAEMAAPQKPPAPSQLLIAPGRDTDEVWAWLRDGRDVRFLHAMSSTDIERAA